MTSIYIQPCDIQNANINNNFTMPSNTTGPKPTSTKDTPIDHETYLREINELRKQVESLQRNQDVLEAEKEELLNQSCDLRALMTRVTQENEKKLRRFEKKNRALSSRLSSLQVAIDCCFENSSYFDQMSEYWKDME